MVQETSVYRPKRMAILSCSGDQLIVLLHAASTVSRTPPAA